jgi:hypothetical protein
MCSYDHDIFVCVLMLCTQVNIMFLIRGFVQTFQPARCGYTLRVTSETSFLPSLSVLWIFCVFKKFRIWLVTFGVQQFCYAKITPSHVESIIEIEVMIAWSQWIVRYQIRPSKEMNIECSTVFDVVGNIQYFQSKQKSCVQCKHLCLCINALNAKPFFQLVLKFWMFTPGYLVYGKVKYQQGWLYKKV